MSPTGSQIAMLGIYLLILGVLVIVAVDVVRTLRRRVLEDHPVATSISRPGRSAGRASRSRSVSSRPRRVRSSRSLTRRKGILRVAALLATTATALAFAAHAWAAPELPGGVTPFWQAVGTCETGHIGEPGDGAPRWDWGSKHRHLEGSRYEGFTGFAPSTWRWWAAAIGVLRRYPHAYDAPPATQVSVARYGRDRYGTWGCMLHHPEYFAGIPGR